MKRPFLFIHLKPYPEIGMTWCRPTLSVGPAPAFSAKVSIALNDHFVKLVAWYDKEWVIPAK
jgi:hypothetical protein